MTLRDAGTRVRAIMIAGRLEEVRVGARSENGDAIRAFGDVRLRS